MRVLGNACSARPQGQHEPVARSPRANAESAANAERGRTYSRHKTFCSKESPQPHSRIGHGRCLRSLRLSGNSGRIAVPVEREGKTCLWAAGRVEMPSADELILTIYLRNQFGSPVEVDVRARSTVPLRRRALPVSSHRWWRRCTSFRREACETKEASAPPFLTDRQ